MSTINTTKSITLRQFRLRTALYWEENADWWIRVLDTKTGIPLWEFKRGDLRIFNEVGVPDDRKMRRVTWTEFQRERIGSTKAMLRDRGRQVVVLTIHDADIFLARLPQDEIVDDGSQQLLGEVVE